MKKYIPVTLTCLLLASLPIGGAARVDPATLPSASQPATAEAASQEAQSQPAETQIAATAPAPATQPEPRAQTSGSEDSWSVRENENAVAQAL